MNEGKDATQEQRPEAPPSPSEPISQTEISIEKTQIHPTYIKLSTVFAVSLIAGAILAIALSTNLFILSSGLLLLIVPGLLIRRKLTNIILPYLVSLSLLIFVAGLRMAVDAHSSSPYDIRGSFQYILIWNNSTLILYAALVAAAASLLVYCLISYGPKFSRYFWEGLFRAVCVFTLCLGATGYIYDVMIGTSEANVGYKEAIARQQAHQAASLKEDLAVVTVGPQIEKEYRFYLAKPEDKDKGPEYGTYNVVYFDQYGGTLRMAGSINKVSPDCSHDPNLIAFYGQANKYRCDVSFITPKGTVVYAPRDLSVQSLKNSDVLFPRSNVHSDAEVVWVQYGDTLVEISAYNLVTKDAYSRFIDNVVELTGNDRDAFVEQYIKPQEILTSYGIAKVKEQTHIAKNSSVKFLPRAIVAAVYVALLLWAVELIFEKASFARWKLYVPFYGTWVLVEIAGRPGWWSLFAWVPNPSDTGVARAMLSFPPLYALYPLLVILNVIKCILFLLTSKALAEVFGKSPWFAVLLILPPFPGYLILGFSKAKYLPNTLIPSSDSDRT